MGSAQRDPSTQQAVGSRPEVKPPWYKMEEQKLTGAEKPSGVNENTQLLVSTGKWLNIWSEA